MSPPLYVSSPRSRAASARPSTARRFLFASVLLGVASAGCELPPATAVAVSVKTELAIGVELALVSYRVFGATDDPEHTKPVSQFTAPAQSLDKPFIITRAHADEFLLSVEGFARDGGEPVVVYREHVTFKPGKTLALPVFLSRACYQRACWFDGLTCYGEAYGGTPAGECEKYPERDLRPIERPGDESHWQPVPTTLLDAGLGARTPLDDEYDDDEPYPRPEAGVGPLGCSGLTTSRSCWPNSLDGSVQLPLLPQP